MEETLDCEPDYTGYALEELLDAATHINREKYPERAQRLEGEIARRTAGHSTAEGSLSGGPHPQMPPSELPLSFRGTAREYFRIWIVNLCLTLLTLGIFSAWAKVRKRRYLYSHTTLAGTPFQYLGKPIPILKGRVIAAMGFSAYYLSTNFITALLPYVLATGLVVAPWVLVRGVAFNARYSAFRNMTFHFDGRYRDALKVLYAWGIIPSVAIGMMFDWPGKSAILGTASAIFGLFFPWWLRRLRKFILEHTSYGGKKGTFSATGGQLFRIYLAAGLLLLAVLIMTGVLAAVTFLFARRSLFPAYIIIVPLYAGYALMYAYIQAHSGNLYWNHTCLGPLRFQSTLRCSDLMKLYVTNALGIVISLGLLIPWAVMRTLKYRADNMRVLQEGELGEFQGSDTSSVEAVGSEAMDFFDVDLSL